MLKPHLERLSGEFLALRTSISGIEGRLDISANGVYGGRFEKLFFDVRVFNPCAKSNSETLPTVHRKHKVEKRDAMSNVSEKLNIVHSYLLFFPAREAWSTLLPRFRKDLLRWSARKQKLLRIVKCFSGFDVVLDSRFSDLRSCVSVDRVHHIGDRGMIA